MAKPPESPPSSDVDGVDRDRQPIDRPANAGDPGGKLKDEEDQASARPKPSRS